MKGTSKNNADKQLNFQKRVYGFRIFVLVGEMIFYSTGLHLKKELHEKKTGKQYVKFEYTQKNQVFLF